MTWPSNLGGKLRFQLSYFAATRRSRVILSAGMPRSGSTWLFNAARLLLQTEGPLSSGWIGDWFHLPRRAAMLIKVHDHDSFLARHARSIVYSYRDIRDALASQKRKFGTEPTIEQARNWLASDRQWRKRAAFILRYESMLENPEQIVGNLARALNVTSFDPREVLRQLDQLHFDAERAMSGAYDRETLFHPGHLTDGRHGSWHDWLSPALVQQIETECGAWLEQNGYGAGESHISHPVF